MQGPRTISLLTFSILFLVGLVPVLANDCLTPCHEKVASMRFSHPNIEKCQTCHGEIEPPKDKERGHAATQEKKAKEECLRCHQKKIIDNFTHLHGPLKDGQCLPCHRPHSSDYESLLIDQYPQANYVKYSKSEYRLCFRCHRRDLLMFPDTSFATGFRDNEKNLHFYHVKRPKRGENCRLCHRTHGAMLPKLMAQKVPFGRWNMPIGFTLRPNGGACVPGCHDPRAYTR